MLTYHLAKGKKPLYQQLYDCIRADILGGRLTSDEKMPSKRTLSENLGISIITVEKAYNQLIDEGYLVSRPKRGYYVSHLADLQRVPEAFNRSTRLLTGVSSGTDKSMQPGRKGDETEGERTDKGGEGRRGFQGTSPDDESAIWFDFSSGRMDPDHFPFATWARIMRQTLSMREKDLLTMPPCCGARPLREAIAGHLSSFRGMTVSPDQIVVGSGTEYLTTMLIRLLGQDRVYCLENPGYSKMLAIYRTNMAKCVFADVDDQGMRADQLAKSGADVAHISPAHHFPTGAVMPISRRYEILAWAYGREGRYIIEDDYDSEFRTKGRPLPTLQSIDQRGRVIYMNTFSKSLASTIRVSYMVLPPDLAGAYMQNLGFYSCTVSVFDQYVLAAFMSQGYFEKHINRMRLIYSRRRAHVMEEISRVFGEGEGRIIEHEAGLHLILQVHTVLPDETVQKRLLERGIRIRTITDYDMVRKEGNRHQFLVSYSGMDLDRLPKALKILREEAGLWTGNPAESLKLGDTAG